MNKRQIIEARILRADCVRIFPWIATLNLDPWLDYLEIRVDENRFSASNVGYVIMWYQSYIVNRLLNGLTPTW